MAFITADLALISSVNGYGLYRYDTLDQLDVVEDAGYFNNVDDDQVLGKGDYILALTWATALRTGTLSESKPFVVTNVIPNDAAANAGAVNVAEIWITTGISSQG